MRYLLKYAGILAVVLCLSLSGFLKARFKREEISRLKAIEAAFSRADDMLTLAGKSRAEILSDCFDGVLKGGIKGRAAGIVNTFLDEFGSGDSMLEHNRITLAKKEISSLIISDSAKYSQLHKIWQTAGVCAGLAVGIMFI